MGTIVTHYSIEPNLKETEMNTIKTPNFTRRITKIMVAIRTRACIDDVDAEAIEKILQDELIEECRMLDSYYWEEHYNNYCNEISSVRTSAYEAGYDEGYADGHSGGYSESHSAV